MKSGLLTTSDGGCTKAAGNPGDNNVFTPPPPPLCLPEWQLIVARVGFPHFLHCAPLITFGVIAISPFGGVSRKQSVLSLMIWNSYSRLRQRWGSTHPSSLLLCPEKLILTHNYHKCDRLGFQQSASHRADVAVPMDLWCLLSRLTVCFCPWTAAWFVSAGVILMTFCAAFLPWFS